MLPLSLSNKSYKPKDQSATHKSLGVSEYERKHMVQVTLQMEKDETTDGVVTRKIAESNKFTYSSYEKR